jgi:hypothetical protein
LYESKTLGTPGILILSEILAECLFLQSYGEVSQLVLDHLLGLLGCFFEGFSIRPAATRSAPVLKLCWLPRPGSPPSFDVVLVDFTSVEENYVVC